MRKNTYIMVSFSFFLLIKEAALNLIENVLNMRSTFSSNMMTTPFLRKEPIFQNFQIGSTVRFSFVNPETGIVEQDVKMEVRQVHNSPQDVKKCMVVKYGKGGVFLLDEQGRFQKVHGYPFMSYLRET